MVELSRSAIAQIGTIPLPGFWWSSPSETLGRCRRQRDAVARPPQTGAPMPRYFFHILDGTALTDETGVELADLAAARIEAVKLVAGVLRGGVLPGFWDGEV